MHHVPHREVPTVRKCQQLFKKPYFRFLAATTCVTVASLAEATQRGHNTGDTQLGKMAGTGSNARSTDHGWRLAIVVALDLLAWVTALAIARWFYEIPQLDAAAVAVTIAAVVLHAVLGVATGLYRGRFKHFSFDEAGAVATSTVGIGVVLALAEQQFHNVPDGGQVIIIATSLAMCGMLAHRYVRRLRARHLANKALLHREPVIVYGAGEGGERSISAMRTVADSPYRPVALIDDDPLKRRLQLDGLRVEGTGDDLAAVAQRHNAGTVLLAMPSATSDELRALHQQVQAAGLDTLVMPPVQRLFGEGSPRELRRYTDEDVLNRGIVEIDSDAVAAIIQGARVLVTGAGGSIGSELVRQLATFEPASLIALDRDDSLLHHTMASLAPEQRPTCVPVLADIRDIDRLDEVFGHHRPEVVFHAAALKHVPALEGAVSEGWKTNVLGTNNVISSAERYGVQRFVNVSTDKAANPTNVLGLTKRIGERLAAAAARRTHREFVSVRFGNVIGSRGSALETFERQIDEGGPVTITHPDVTRYFMAVREAVRLTMQAAAIGHPGDVLVLDMGEPMSVLDIAQQLIERSGRDIEIVYTGLRPGEKMHEELLGHGESARRPYHPMIDHVTVDPLELTTALDACRAASVGATTLPGLHLMVDHESNQHTISEGASERDGATVARRRNIDHAERSRSTP